MQYYLHKTWRQMLHPEATPESVHKNWGGEEEFLAIYLIAEKGLDVESPKAVDEAFHELTGRTSWALQTGVSAVE